MRHLQVCAPSLRHRGRRIGGRPLDPAGGLVANCAGTIADHESILVDGQTFKITPERQSPTPPTGSRRWEPGSWVRVPSSFRSGEKLYIMGAPLLLQRSDPPGPRATWPCG